MMDEGALDWAGHAADRAELVLAAMGAYRLGEVLRIAPPGGARGAALCGLPPGARTVISPGPREG